MSKITRYQCDVCRCETLAELPYKVSMFCNCGYKLDKALELCTPCYKKLINYLNKERKKEK